MGKNNKKRPPVPDESNLILPIHPALTDSAKSSAPIVDTHTHLISTFSEYRRKYPEGKFETIFDFVRGVYHDKDVAAIVDVYCEAPVQKAWKELADSAVSEQDRIDKWGGLEYWFVMGVHPHEAKHYNDAVESDILEAMKHPRNVGWGEIGLDYHYDNSPRDIQQDVFTRQLRHAVRLGKPLTIHTREADDDTERILKAEVPKDHKIHIHCFTDAPEFAQRLLDHFPNLYIGVTGVITYSTNLNTSSVIRSFASSPSSGPMRIVLETDAPYMIPGNIYKSLKELRSGSRLPLCHTAMIPWTAEFVANEANIALGEGADTNAIYDVPRVMKEARENARAMYGV